MVKYKVSMKHAGTEENHERSAIVSSVSNCFFCVSFNFVVRDLAIDIQKDVIADLVKTLFKKISCGSAARPKR